MISFTLTLIEKDEIPEKVLYFNLETEQANILFSKIEEEFSGFIVEKSRENRPYLYLKLVDLPGTERHSMAAFMPNVCFKVDVKERMIDFINEIEKP